MPDNLFEALEEMFAEGNDYLTAQRRDRPYDGQSHTDAGERGRQEVSGVTMRDIRDAFVIGAFQASGFFFEEEGRSKYEGTIYDLPWDELDPGAVMNNAICEIENRMGIWPNLPGVEPRERGYE